MPADVRGYKWIWAPNGVGAQSFERAPTPQPGGFESFVWLLEQPKASDLPVLDGEYPRAARGYFDSLATPKVGGIRDHDFGTRINEAVNLNLGLLKREEELVPQGLDLATTAIDTFERTSGT